ncbi:hypothetical protein [Stieleria mannarensis]|uniref:hypothetical protein n=1 Tax=Stieleria mannarensis TaxID=2755585 RepID=UPI001604095A|nr:hypothetical protein [Rhodopirellula sp. JC639]
MSNDAFSKRFRLKRKVLDAVNSSQAWPEELCGLSVNAISRWCRSTSVDENSEVAELLKKIAGNLGFLATKSQMSISEADDATFIDVEVQLEQLSQLLGEHQ